ncbi:MAG: hypothetical protein ACOYH4_04270 [Saccharofermentanales bacterium]|jgi:hypothetical protein
MKVKYIGENSGISLIKNNVYESLGYEEGFIRVIDETEEDYLFEPENFVIIKE